MLKNVGAWAIVSTLGFGAAALAATPPAEMAGEMLARAQSVDMKCNYLTATDKDTLSGLVARAEIRLANRESVEATKATMLRGHQAGKSAACNPNEKEQVTNILNAAKWASSTAAEKPMEVTQVPTTPIVAQPAPLVAQPAPLQPAPVQTVVAQPKLIEMPIEAKMQKPLFPVKAAKLEKVKPNAPDMSLRKYQAITAQYYLASRCGSMPAGQLGSLYKSIVSGHSQVMANHSGATVAQALRQARSDASAQSCS